MALLVEQLSGRERGGEQVHRVGLEVAPGECLVVLGAAGAGAALLLRLIAGEVRPSQGRIWLGGREIGGLTPAQRPLCRVDLAAPLPARRSLADLIGAADLRDGLADLLGLSGLEGEPLGRLAPALRPRAALALALARRPAALLLTEPGRGMAPADRAELYELLGRAVQALNLCLLAASSEPEAAFALAGRVAVMHGGRLLEVGSVQEIYLRPQTDIGAAALGPVNLLVGSCTDDGVRVGPFVFPTRVTGAAGEERLRVQLMFRPEDVDLGVAPGDLAGTPLGRAEVAALRYAGSVERLRLRLPPIPGVRPVAPVPPFGEPGLLIEAARTAEQVCRAPLGLGAGVWAAVRRFHALPHPGLHMAVLGPELPAARRLAERAAARLTTLDGNEPPEVALERLHRRQPCDLAVVPARGGHALGLLGRLIERCQQHLLLLDELRDPPARGLICVAGHESDKATVQFAGRLLRHLGASAALLTVLPDRPAAPPDRVTRFHAAARETLAALGVPARSIFRTGAPGAAILAECRNGGHDLLVVGASALHRGPRLIHALARQASPAPLLVVRHPAFAPGTDRQHNGIVAGLLAD